MNIKEYRLLNKMSQSDLAESCGVCRATIINIENGKTPSYIVARKIAEKTGLNWTDMVVEKEG